MAYVPTTGQVILFGGLDANNHFLNDTWSFALVTNQLLHRSWFDWAKLTTTVSPPAREDAVMDYDPKSARLILATGFNGSTNLQDTWAFSPGSAQASPSWQQIFAGPTPARSTAAMGKCAVNANSNPDRLLLFGGFQSASPFVLGDTWIYMDSLFSSLVWGQVNPATQPPPRFSQAMAYYPISNQAVMYGGGAAGGVFSDTWNAFCGSWTQASPAHNPGPREFGAMAVGSGGFNLLLFGGQKIVPPGVLRDTNETWTWGRRAACLPRDGSEIPKGTEVSCEFDEIAGVQFDGWSSSGFAPHEKKKLVVSFRAKKRGLASITADWSDADGAHSMTYTYTVTKRDDRDDDDDDE
jgi:hypothetical protein